MYPFQNTLYAAIKTYILYRNFKQNCVFITWRKENRDKFIFKNRISKENSHERSLISVAQRLREFRNKL